MYEQYDDDFVSAVTAEEYWGYYDHDTDWEDIWDDYDDYDDYNHGYSYGIPDSQIVYDSEVYKYDWSDWDI